MLRTRFSERAEARVAAFIAVLTVASVIVLILGSRNAFADSSLRNAVEPSPRHSTL